MDSNNEVEQMEKVPDAAKNTEKTPDNKAKKTPKTRTSKRKSKADEKISGLQTEIEELKDKYLRLFAEFDNYKKRVIREKLELMKSAAEDTMSGLLSVLDDFDRAKKSADDESTDEVFSDGVDLVYRKLYSVLDQKGLLEMKTTGEVFDPEKHEAISEIEAGKKMKGKIVDTIEKGYLLNDKIIRFAKVVVGR